MITSTTPTSCWKRSWPASKAREDQRIAEVVVIEGLVPTDKQPFANKLNYDVAKALDADMVFVTHPGNDSSQKLKERIELACSTSVASTTKRIVGCVINKVGARLTSMA